MRILVISVGTGRNRQDIAEAVCFSLDRHRADRAVFLCSAKTHEETLPLVLGLLDWPEDHYRVDVCANEDDVQDLFIEWNARWGKLLNEWLPAEVIVDFTSGTKPMSAAAVLLALARNAFGLSYVIGERDSTGRVSRSTDIRCICPDLVIAHRQLRLAVEHFHAGSFAAARLLVEPYLKIETLPEESLREVARSVHFLAEAYEAWDRFDYNTAHARLHDSKKFWNKWGWVEDAKRLEDNASLITAVKKSNSRQNYDPALAADLLGNTRRCMQRHRWDDAVARLYRSCELLAQMRLLQKYGQKTGDLDPDKLPAPLQAEYRERKVRAADGKIKLGSYEAYHLLQQLGDPLGQEYIARYGRSPKWGELKGLLDARNQSLLAHGITPIRQDKAEKLYEHVKALADIADPAIFAEWLPKAEPIHFRPF